jgi:ferredoxin-NADP reductase
MEVRPLSMQLVQRALLTAVADIKLVRAAAEQRDRWGRRLAAVEVASETVGDVTITSECTTTMEQHDPSSCQARLALVLERIADLDYAAIARCIDVRVGELDSLSGRQSAAGLILTATVHVHIADSDPSHRVVAAPDDAVDEVVLDQALERNSTDRAFGLRDMRLASLEYRLCALLRLGVEEQPWLNEAMCSRGGEIEELGAADLDEACCATGCEPCVWESYYLEQARERRGERGSAAREGKRQRTASTSPAGLPCLTPDRLQPISLLEREQHTPDTLLLAFAATLSEQPPVPWHVRVRLTGLDGAPVTRSYTVLRCDDGRLELLVKIHPGGRCTQSLAALSAGHTVQMRGPIVTDEALRALLGPQGRHPSVQCTGPTAIHCIHCVSAGTGMVPMYQLVDWLLRQQERAGGDSDAAHGDSKVAAAACSVRMWSIHRTRQDVVLADRVAALQQRGRACRVPVHCTYVLTREQDDATMPRDLCGLRGGCAAMRCGRLGLSTLVEGLPRGELESALLVICGPEAFNRDMAAAASTLWYADGHVFVRETPREAPPALPLH